MSRSTGQAHLLSLLKQVFGYTGFRPHQEEIIRDALAGRDVFALLPTGGGKSLCFQLPALVRPGLTVVISPLIALMKDQVDQLRANGVAATFLNSSLSEKERKARWRGLHQGEFKLLYLSPERLMIGEGSLFEALRQWNVQQVAVDEAHCISEWGHDFRPEYRQLSLLREQFTDLPFMALTATATTRVRDDIIRQLHLKDPSVHVASFNRPNLTYRVIPKSQAYRQILDFVRARPKESGIVYCFSRASADSVAAKLAQDGVKSLAYHAGLSSKERSANQDTFLRDEVRVVCATVAFGMGINKPNVRFVIHHDLPKNIEGYYQETGRAGRDGLPGECLLLYSPGDVAKQTAFIAEKTDPEEQRIAREQLQQISHYADSSECRRAGLLGYFGEFYPQPNCGTCDNCLTPRSTWDGTVAAQKFLSCVFRIRQKSGFGTGFNHVIAVLTGSESEKVIQWGHDTLSTYGIGSELSRSEWASIGRELVRLGYLRQTSEQFSILEMTPDGMAALKDRRSITLTKPMERSRPKAERIGDIDCDELLFEKLRLLRKSQADSLGVPPYIVFGDNSLRLMARDLPTTDEEFLTISGVGERKLRDYGEEFLTEIREHLRNNPRR